MHSMLDRQERQIGRSTATVVLVLFAYVSLCAMAADGPVIVSPSVPQGPVTSGASILVGCNVQHPLGHSAIERVALTIRHPERTMHLPRLYDDGTHGDAVAGDWTYSRRFRAPAAVGTHTASCLVIDRSGTEIEGEPAAFEVR